MDKENINKYQKYKNSIKKWRDINHDKYLLQQHNYYKNIMNDPDKKKKRLEQLKNNKIIRDANKIKKKVGRPSKY